MIQEWRCTYCGMVNPIGSRYCGHADDGVVGCGAPRDFLLGEQEVTTIVLPAETSVEGLGRLADAMRKYFERPPLPDPSPGSYEYR